MSNSGGANSGAGRVGEWRVQLYVYDLSGGLARALSQQFLGKQIDGIWHTGIVVYGQEYFYGGGIQATRPGCSMAGRPGQVIDLGWTRLPPATFHEFLRGVSHRFTSATYSLLEHNCNNFTNECALFLLGSPIPAFITGLPAEALATPFGQMLRPMIAQMEGQMRAGGAGGAGMIPWGSGDLDLPRSAETLPPERMVDEASNPAAPHSVADSAAALAAQALASQAAAQGAPRPEANVGVAPPAAQAAPLASAAAASAASVAASAAASSSSSPVPPRELVSVLTRSGPAKPLTSFDKKAKSFQVLLRSAAKKHPATPAGLSTTDEATLSAMVDALATDDAAGAQVSEPACALLESLLCEWAPANLFAVLGLLRLTLLRPECRAFYADQGHASRLLDRALELLPSEEKSVCDTPSNVQTMLLCALTNLLALPSSKPLAARSDLWSALRAILGSSGSGAGAGSPTRLMCASALYNATLLLPRDVEADALVEAASWLVEALGREEGLDVASRLAIALAELMTVEGVAPLMLGLDLAESIKSLRARFPNGAEEASKQLHATLGDMEKMMQQAEESFQAQ